MSLPELTLGIEEEYQIIDPATRQLASRVPELLADEICEMRDELKPEFLQSQIEVGTKVCRDLAEARQEIVRLRGGLSRLAQRHGLAIGAASSHPMSTWEDQSVTSGERYLQLETDLGQVARQLVIFGMHVHVGIDDPELRIDVLNQARYFVPHFLALSTSSPFWAGHDTGLKSYRSVIFGNMPRSGIPPLFDSWSDFQGFLDTLVATESIDEPTKIWWDVRPHPKYPTLEFRMTDICTKVDEVMCVTALLQALVAKLIRLRRRNQSWRQYRHHFINENKWRAARYGLEGKMIDFGRQSQAPVRDLALELLELVDDVLDELGTRAEAEYLHTMLAEGSSADRQLATWRRTGSFSAVVDQVIEETLQGCESEIVPADAATA